MTVPEIRQKLTDILNAEFGMELGGIDPAVSIFEQVPVDSMMLVALAAKIEQEFGIELPLNFMENPTLDHFFHLIDGASAGK